MHKKKSTHTRYPIQKTRFGKKAGLAPGTVAYLGEERSFNIKADLFEFSADTLNIVKDIPLSSITFNEQSHLVRWINITGIHHSTVIEQVGKQLNLHSLVLEDIVHTEQRPKLDDYEDYLYLVVKMIDYTEDSETITTEQLSIVLKENTIISFIEDEGDLFDPLRERIKKGNLKLRKSGSDYLLYSMLDMIVDNYFLVLEKIGDRLEELEFHLLDESTPGEVEHVHRLKRELIYLRKSIWPMREVIGLLTKSDNKFLRGNTDIYLRDVYDHCVHAIDTLETYRDLTSGLMDVYLSSLSNRMNRVMKTLTIIATIFIPLTFIVGVYGMNFDFMPELHIWWTYPAVWGLMVVITGGMLWYFKRKGWF